MKFSASILLKDDIIKKPCAFLRLSSTNTKTGNNLSLTYTEQHESKLFLRTSMFYSFPFISNDMAREKKNP